MSPRYIGTEHWVTVVQLPWCICTKTEVTVVHMYYTNIVLCANMVTVEYMFKDKNWVSVGAYVLTN